MMPTPDILAGYAAPGPLTTLPDSSATAALLDGLPDALPDLVYAVQGNLIHIFWAERYGVTLSEKRKAEVQIRTAAAMLDTIYAVDAAPLTTPRPNETKLVGNCRDFTVLTVALLRWQGVPARARCGFGTYFFEEHARYEDHWVVEYWHAEQARWIMVDVQLDPFQVDALPVDFDPLDVPRGGPDKRGFVTGPHAWDLVRRQGQDPARFGIFDMHGLAFIYGNFVRDVAALNKVELLPWDVWGPLKGNDSFTDEDFAFLDHLAALVEADDIPAIQALYAKDERLRVPPVIRSYAGGPKPVAITLADEPGFVVIG